MKTARPSGTKTATVPKKAVTTGKSPALSGKEPIPPKKPAQSGDKKSGTKTIVVPPENAEPASSAHPAAGRRAFWSGSIAIGLVNVPVRLHTMVKDKSFSFRLLHRDDGQPLRYDRVCSKDGRVIPWTETVKGYEVRKGEFLVFTPEELNAVKPESDRKIRIEKFVFYLSLDPMYFDSSYVLLPDKSEEAYNLLVTTLQDLGRAGVGTITLRTKEYPVVVHAYRGGLVLTTLRYADEVTAPDTFEAIASLPSPKESELALARRIITELSGDFSILDYHDRYRESLMSLIGKKLAGEKLVYEEPHPEEAKELMQALRETLATLEK